MEIHAAPPRKAMRHQDRSRVQSRISTSVPPGSCPITPFWRPGPLRRFDVPGAVYRRGGKSRKTQPSSWRCTQK